jgi:hypothetical protein
MKDRQTILAKIKTIIAKIIIVKKRYKPSVE